MGFTESTFIFLFLPIAITIYLLVGLARVPKACNITLIALDLVFYAWNGMDTLAFFVLLVVLTYLMGNVAAIGDGGARRRGLGIGIATLLAALVAVKYVPFLTQTLNDMLALKLAAPSLLAPLGISFLVFESISYVVDVYRGDATAGSFLDVLLFLSLFPKLISGPIVRWKDFEPQVNKRMTSLDGVSCGMERIAVGLAKKAILADFFGAQIQSIQVTTAIGGMDAPTAWLRSVLFFFQLYYDFSGYSDIAIGICQVFGFGFSQNFNYPYVSTSISEFWRRWHISLGTWFREYVYIPLGGNRRGNVYAHLFVVFLLTGIWHGANWTFFLWGVANGVCVMFERLVRNMAWYKAIPAVVKWAVTMVLVLFGWTLFMAPDLPAAAEFFQAMFCSQEALPDCTWEFFLTQKVIMLLAVAAIGSILGATPIPRAMWAWTQRGIGLVLRKMTMLVLFAMSIMTIVNSSYSPFLYFQF